MKRKVKQGKSSKKVSRSKVAKRGSAARLPRVSANAKRQPVRAAGGARTGAGRQALYGEEKLEEKISVRLNSEQTSALYAVCEERRVSPNAFFREAALKRAGQGELGIGLERVCGTMREGKKLSRPEGGVQVPVKCTPSQKAALDAHCRLLDVDEGTFVKESALREAGLEHLLAAAKQG